MSGYALAIGIASTYSYPVLLWSFPGPSIPDPQFLVNDGWSTSGVGAFTPNGTLLAVGHQQYPYLTLYDTSDWSEITGPSVGSSVTRVAASNTQIAISSGATLTVYAIADWSEIGTVNAGSAITGITYAPNGETLAVVTASNATASLRVYASADLEPVTVTTPPTGNATAVAWSPDGALLAVGQSATPGFKVFNTATWTVAETPAPDTVHALAWSPDSTMLALADGEAISILALSASSWSWVSSAAPAVAGVTALVWSPDGTQLLAGDASSTIHVVTVATWTVAATHPTGSGNARSLSVSAVARAKSVSGILFGPDGKPCERPVYLLRRADLAVLASTTSGVDGSYTLSSFQAGSDECLRLALDTTGDYNDRIKRVTPG